MRLPVHLVEKLSRRPAPDPTWAPAGAGTRPTPRWRRDGPGRGDRRRTSTAISRTPASLDALVGDDGGTTLGDLVDAADPSPEDIVVESDSRDALAGWSTGSPTARPR